MMKMNEIKAMKQAAREEAKLKKQQEREAEKARKRQEREAEKARKQAIKEAKAAKKAFDKEQMTLHRQRVIAAREVKKIAIENAKQEFADFKKRSYQRYIKSVGYVLMRDRRTIQAVEEIEEESPSPVQVLKELVLPETVMMSAVVVTKGKKIVPTQSRWENMPHLKKLKHDNNYELLECQGMSTNDYDCARLDDPHMLRQAQSCLHGYHSFEAIDACEAYCDNSKIYTEAADKKYNLLDGSSITRKEMIPNVKYKLSNGTVAEVNH